LAQAVWLILGSSFDNLQWQSGLRLESKSHDLDAKQ